MYWRKELTLNHLACTFFFFNATPPTEIYTLSLHDALPISSATRRSGGSTWYCFTTRAPTRGMLITGKRIRSSRSEEHTSELQSHVNVVCRLLLEKKN